MSDLDADFEAAQRRLMGLGKRPDNESLLRLYALYKQAVEGDVAGERPGFFDLVGTAKYEAREKLRGMPAEDARRRYIELVAALAD